MEEFGFQRPTGIEEAVAALRADEDAKLLGGGQSLIPLMKLDLALPSSLVSLAGVEALRGIHRDGDQLVVGAATSHAEVAASADVAGAIPALAALAGGIGDPQVRNRGTLGGSVAHADPAADYPAALLALRATIHTDRRDIAADDFFLGVFESLLERDELITRVAFPIPERAAYAKFPHPASRFALVGVFVAGRADGVRVAVTGAAASVFRVDALEQALVSEFSAEALLGVELHAAGLRDDADASAEYRAHLIGLLTRRAVASAR